MIRKILIGFGVFSILFLIATVVLSAFFEKEIGDKIITEVNKSLKTELSVKDFDLNFFGGFPNISAELIDVVVKDTKKKNLLQAKSIGFKLGFFSLFKTKMNIKEVQIEDGALMVVFDKKGRSNYDIMKSEGSEEGGDMAISLKEATLKNIELIYEDKRTEQEAVIILEDAIFSGEFSSDKFELTSNADMVSRFVDMGEFRYLIGKEIRYDAKLYINSDQGLYEFEKLDVAIDGNVFKVDGFVDNDAKSSGTNIDLAITCSEGKLGSIIQLLPEQYLEPLNDFTGTGKFLFETIIKGRLSSKSNPQIDTKFILKDGRITSPRLEDDLKDVAFSAHFTNGKYQKASSTVFEIKNFKGYFNRELVEMKVKVNNGDDPRIDFKLDGAIPMKSVYKLFDNPNITSGRGEVEIKNLAIKGKYKDMLSMSRINRVDASGEMVLDDASLIFKDEKIIFDRGAVILKDNDLKMDGLKLEGAGSEITFNGHFENLLPVLFADSLNTKKAELKFKADLRAKEFDGDRLVALTAVPENQKDEGSQVTDSLQTKVNEDRAFISNFLKGTFNAVIDEFNYNKIEGEDFEGKIVFDNNEVSIKGEASAMDGLFDIDGKIFLEKEPYLNAKIRCDEIDAHEFFSQSENFGQEVLKADNVSGILNSRMIINAFWNEKGEFLYDDLTVFAGLGITDGELQNFKMLEDFSTIIKMKDLRNIKFVDVENWFQVQKGKVYIPSMFVRSNAVNLEVSGTHTFEQDVDYNVKVNAGQVLLNRLKKHNPKLDPQPSQKRGWLNLFYKIKGSLNEDEEYDVNMSKRSVKKALERSVILKRRVQKELERQFGPIQLLEKSSEDDRGEIFSGSTKPSTASIKKVTPKKEKPTVKVVPTEDDDDEEYIDGF